MKIYTVVYSANDNLPESRFFTDEKNLRVFMFNIVESILHKFNLNPFFVFKETRDEFKVNIKNKHLKGRYTLEQLIILTTILTVV